jgi:hypothetical protein
MIDKKAFDLIEDYYARPSPQAAYEPGRFCESLIFFQPSTIDAIKFDIEAANRGDSLTYTIGPPDDKTFDHSPVTRPHRLDQHEALIAVPAKHRPAIILSTPMSPLTGIGRVIARDFPESFLVAPLFTFHERHTNDFRIRIEAWEYNMLFYLPQAEDVEESFLRFDRCQVVPKGRLRLMPVQLSPRGLDALRQCWGWFMSGHMDEIFAEFRRLLLEAIGRPGAAGG